MNIILIIATHLSIQLILLELPFGDTPDRVSVQKWHSMLTNDYLRPVLPATLPPRLKKIIEQGWLSYPSMRPSADDILAIFDDTLLNGGGGDASPVSTEIRGGLDSFA